MNTVIKEMLLELILQLLTRNHFPYIDILLKTRTECIHLISSSKYILFLHKAVHHMYIHVYEIGQGKAIYAFKGIQFSSLIQKHK